MEDTTMKKKYMKPEQEVVKIQHHYQLLTGSEELPKNEEEVEDSW